MYVDIDVFTRINNVAGKLLALLLHIRKVAGSNLDPEVDYPHKEFSWFSSIAPDKFRDTI
jgi:hypothetical protein